jgi:EPS-associated MarR family transcriptional regulator
MLSRLSIWPFSVPIFNRYLAVIIVDKGEQTGDKVHPMNARDQEIRYRLLKILSQQPSLSQRDMARQMGISLGKVNYCVSELAKRGLIDVIRFKSARNKIPYTYVLTPRGMTEKARITANFLRRKVAEYEEIQRQIAELSQEVQEDRQNGFQQPETSQASTRAR